jgi:translation initiation factor 2 gamma subunit (eIF-2gamma)
VLAEEAARKEQDVEGRSGGTADAIDVRQDIFSEAPGEDLNVKRTMLTVAAIAAGAILLIAVVAILVVVTGVTNGS